MDDEVDGNVPVMRRPPRTAPRERRPHTQGGEASRISRREQAITSYVTLAMDNVAFTMSDKDPLQERESDPSSRLRRAVTQTCYEDCKKLLDKGTNVNSVDETDGGTLLHRLANKALKGDNDTLKIASLLINRGAELDFLDHQRNTPLHIAAREGLCKLCELLLNEAVIAQKPLINSLNDKRMSPLHLAAKEGQCEVVKLLLWRGAEPNVKDDRAWYPLHYAVDRGCVQSCRALAPHYQGDAKLTKKQEPPLMLAAKKGYCNTCEELPAEKLDLDYTDKDQNTALHIVAKRGYDKFVKLLLKLGASLDLQNSYGHTPLMVAVAKDRDKCAAVLVSGEASLTMTSHDQSNILHIAISNKSMKCTAYLLKHNRVKELINEKDKEGFTPLLLAIEKRSTKCLKLLEDAGAYPQVGNEKGSVIYFSPSYRGTPIMYEMLLQENNVNITNENKMTPLHIAAQEGFNEVCKSLLRKGARINACDKGGRTPLHLAALSGHETTVTLLLKHGANKRIKDDKKSTVLHCAAFAGKLECCQVLLYMDRGLMKEKDKQGKYALDIAFQCGRFEVFAFLLKKFSQLSLLIPEDLTKRFHSYVHQMMSDKKQWLMEAVIKTNWWEVGFGAAKERLHGQEPCQLFRDMVKFHPGLAYDLMTKCRSKLNFRLLEDNFTIEGSEDASNTSRCGNPEEARNEAASEADTAGTQTLVHKTLNWMLRHPVSVMVSEHRLDLMQHSLIEDWAAYKWKAYACWIYLILMGIRAFSITMLVWLLLFIKKSVKIKKDDKIWSLPQSLEVPKYILGLMFVSFLMQLLVDLNSWCRLRHKANLPVVFVRCVGLLLNFTTLVSALICGHCGTTVYIAGILGMVVAGLDFIFALDQLPRINILTSITREFLLKYAKGIICVASIIILFAFIFHLLFIHNEHFKTMNDSILSIALWQLGDFNQEVFFDIRTFRIFSHVLFIMYLITFGALIVTIIQAPSITRDASLFNKVTGMINLLFEIDVCFPWLRRVCEGSQLDKKTLSNSGNDARKNNRLSGFKITFENNDCEASVEKLAFMTEDRSSHCKIMRRDEEERESREHALVMRSLDSLRSEMKNLQSHIRVLQRKTLAQQGEANTHIVTS